ncbi:META domain-containing protein [Methanofollis sp. UBA420]|uniref:META domain-containing protein n=1 Tax=Methanofollis sp. UBA420 TaxID=1915514 RepID=UPI00316ABD83
MVMRPMKDTMRKALPLAGTAIVLAACLLAAGCTGQAPGGKDNETVQGIDLNGTAWDLVSYAQNSSMVNALEGTPVTLVFGENATAGGSAGCNAYSASYTVDGKAITFGPAISTQMYCMKPGVMEQESAYLGLLNTVKTYEVKDDTLTFFDEKGTAVLVFKKHVPPEPEPLVGTAWELQWYHDGDAVVSVIAGSEVTAVFDEAGKVAGSAGCNRYFASYTVNGTEMTIGQAGSTLMACTDEDVMKQESTYLRLLGTVASFSIEGEELTLMDANGTKVLMFAKAVPPQPKPLTGTNWTLESLHTGDAVSSVIAGSEITAVFDEDGRIAGSAGCNRYFATYTVNGTEMTIGPAGSTLMACTDEDIMKQESTFLSLLESVASFTIEGDRLSLMDGNGTAVLVFKEAQAPVALPLVGTTWVLDTYHLGDIAVRVIEGTEITAVFGEDGKVTGSAGCNNYFATYNLSGSSLTFGPAGSTKKICAEPEGIMAQEERYLSILKAVRSYEIEGNQLKMLDMNGWRIFAFNAKV